MHTRIHTHVPRMKLRQLEQELQVVRFISEPKIDLEQYPTSAHLAATILYTAESQYGDIAGKTVADLGCGGCILGIGSVMLGAEYVPLRASWAHGNPLPLLGGWCASCVSRITVLCGASMCLSVLLLPFHTPSLCSLVGARGWVSVCVRLLMA